MLISKKEIVKIVQSVPKRTIALSDYVPSAILMLFFERDGQTFLVYIRRTKGETLHSGHMAFPGGKIEPGGESSCAAAIREAYEEIDVAGDSYEYIGDMGYFETLDSKFDAAAHVGWCPKPPVYKQNDFEVAEVVEIPAKVLHSQFRPDVNLDNRQDVISLSFKYESLNSNVVYLWGLTARITHHFFTGWQNLTKQ